MITIEERLPKKIPGLTTLFISFSDNKEIEDAIIENSEVYSENRKTKEIEIPITSLASVVDNISGYDDIDIVLKEEEQKEFVEIDPRKYKTKPFKHQLAAIRYGIAVDNWLLADDPGLGKTLSICYIAQEMKDRGYEHCLVICGINTLKTNWKKEIEKHTDLSCKILGSKINRKGRLVFGGIKDRLADLHNKIEEFFVIVNIETLRDDRVVDLINNGVNRFDLIALDECHVCKDAGSKQGNNLMSLTNSRKKIGISGTLFINEPLDLFVPMVWTGNYNTKKTQFVKYFYNYGGIDGKTLVGYKNLDVLNRDLSKVSLRRTIEDEEVNVDIPPKTIIEEFVDMNDQQIKFYDDIKEGILEGLDKVEITKKSVLGIITRLRQATVMPSVLTSANIESSKLNRAVELAEEFLSKGEKVVIYSEFKEPLKEVYERLKKYNPLLNAGNVSDEVVAENMIKFQNDDKYKVFLATSKKIGAGIDLYAARYMIFLDTPWTYAVTSQCEDRIHRIGAKDKMFIYRLICTNTIDEKVEEIVNKKKVLSEYVVDGEISDDLYDVLVRYIKELK